MTSFHAIPADLHTPLGTYLRLRESAGGSFLLESVVGGERFGRYSFIGLPARIRASSTAARLSELDTNP